MNTETKSAMPLADFIRQVKRLESHFINVQIGEETIKNWHRTIGNLPGEKVSAAIDRICRTSKAMVYGANLAALIIEQVEPALTEATISDVLYHAIALNQSVNGNPHAYLRSLDPYLVDLADRFGLFSRDLSQQDQRFSVRDVARAWLERRENSRRGFSHTQPIPPDRQLQAPPREMTEEQRKLNQSKVREIISVVSRKTRPESGRCVDEPPF